MITKLLAKLTKLDVKVFAMTQKPDKSSTVIPNVRYEVLDNDGVITAYLVATDGYKIVRREVDYAFKAKPDDSMNIPRDILQAVDKVMPTNSLAYLYEDKIVVHEAVGDNIFEIDSSYPVRATIPLTVQTSLNFPPTKSLVERSASSPFPAKSIEVDVKLLADILKQFKQLSDAPNTVRLNIAGNGEVLLMSATENLTGNKVVTGIMPLR